MLSKETKLINRPQNHQSHFDLSQTDSSAGEYSSGRSLQTLLEKCSGHLGQSILHQTSLLNHDLTHTSDMSQSLNFNNLSVRSSASKILLEVKRRQQNASNTSKQIKEILTMIFNEKVKNQTGEDVLKGVFLQIKNKRESKRINKEQVYSKVQSAFDQSCGTEQPSVTQPTYNNSSPHQIIDQSERKNSSVKIEGMSTQSTCEVNQENTYQEKTSHSKKSNRNLAPRLKRKQQELHEAKGLLQSKRIRSTCDSSYALSPSTDSSFESEDEYNLSEKSLAQYMQVYQSLRNSSNEYHQDSLIPQDEAPNNSSVIKIQIKTSPMIDYQNHPIDDDVQSEKDNQCEEERHRYQYDLITRKAKEQLDEELKQIQNLNFFVANLIEENSSKRIDEQ